MIDFIKNMALKAGKIAVEERKKLSSEKIRAKGSEKDIVTDVDLMIEKYIAESIKEKFSEHGIYGEETGKNHNDGEYCWVIDPIDGTASYVHGTPFFSISIALQKNGESIAGAVYAPVLNELFLAEKNGGAFLNGQRIKVSTQRNFGCSMVATGFAFLRNGVDEESLEKFTRIVKDVSDIRRDGSAALDLAYLACGRYDAFWEQGLNLYDIAAGILLVKEAGGRLSDFSGENNFPSGGFIASNTLLHDKMLSYFKL